MADAALSAIIDWGDLTSGDPATDLASIWMLLDDADARAAAWAVYAPFSDGLYRRAMGWAILLGAVLLDTGLIDTPRHAAMGRDVLRRVDRDAQSR